MVSSKQLTIEFSKEQLLALIQKCMVAYLVIWSISPPLSVGMVYRILALGCFGVWFLIALIRNFQIHRIHAFAILYALLVCSVALYTYGSFTGVLKQIGTIMLVIAFLMAYYYKDRWQELSGIVVVALILYTVWNIITSKELIIDPTLARRIVRADDEMTPFMLKGVGGYGLVYSQVCIFPAVLMWTIQSIKKKYILNFVLGVAWTASYVTLILSASYSIALASSVFGLVMLFLYKGKNITWAMILSFAGLALFLAALQYWLPFRNALLVYFDGTKVAKKINDIVSTAETGEVADSIASRIRRYRYSLECIYHFPLIGGWYWESGGGHSALLDTFAQYGLFGGIMFIKTFFSTPLYYKKYSDNKLIIHITNAVLVPMIYVTLLDSAPYDLMFPVLVVMPIMFSEIIKWNNIKIEDSGTNSISIVSRTRSEV